ncbi:hypothetical protein QR685DRAFT_111830 [Neurospora intermedia]|uniref:Transmembrane protein n=1 Tax=Neurospora intermedia TaxID=5142 RepID=A0ABR3D3K2_NEUIN
MEMSGLKHFGNWFLGDVRNWIRFEYQDKQDMHVCHLQICMVKCIYLLCLGQLAQVQLSPQEQESPHMLIVVVGNWFGLGLVSWLVVKVPLIRNQRVLKKEKEGKHQIEVGGGVQFLYPKWKPYPRQQRYIAR